jgi:ATP-binding cassette subfamily F protein uup
MRKERAGRRDQDGSVRLVIQQAERSGKLVADVEEISFSYDDRKIVEQFSTNIIRGDRVGIIGPNGSGKTTLIKLLLGELAPQQGKIRFGTRLNIAYFDQLRNKLDEKLTIKENIAGDSDQVFVGGTPRHVIGYLKDFLFSPAQIMATVKGLSGGERNRLLLAKLFSVPSNVLVLDEPTNDLDAETMELLEDRLLEYGGTVLLVSHDRTFLNNMVTSTIVFEGEGRLQEYVGGYDDWLRQRSAAACPSQTSPKPGSKKQTRPSQEKRKLSYKETHELEGLPQKIAALEKDIQNLTATLNSPDFYVKNDVLKIKAANEQLAALTRELDETYRRWGDLEELAAKFDR